MSTNCQICNISKSKYSCPRCNILYCSVSCYQSETHFQCSEVFYCNCVQEELENKNHDPELKKRMLTILQQLNQESDSDSNSDSQDSLDSDDEKNPDLVERMMNINLNDEDAVWEKLSPKEKNEFRKLISTGNIIKILPEWEPWWKTRIRKVLIQDCKENFEWKNLCPKVPVNIPELSKLTKAKPSPKVPFMFLNVLMSYVFTARWFKGTHSDMPVEGISTCIALSAALRNKIIFETSMEAFLAFESDLFKCSWIDKRDYDRNIIQNDLVDLIKVSELNDSFYSIKAALSDLIVLCTRAASVLKNNQTRHLRRFSDPPPNISLIHKISKKMMYYLSWTETNGNLLVNLIKGE